MLNLKTDLDHEPAANTAAVVTLAAPDSTTHKGRRWAIGGVAWSYDGSPTGGSLTITNGGTQAFKVDITDQGAGFIIPAEPIKGDPNAAIVITLAAGGAGVSGIANIIGAKLVG